MHDSFIYIIYFQRPKLTNKSLNSNGDSHNSSRPNANLFKKLPLRPPTNPDHPTQTGLDLRSFMHRHASTNGCRSSGCADWSVARDGDAKGPHSEFGGDDSI
jgi:hypothetical protein